MVVGYGLAVSHGPGVPPPGGHVGLPVGVAVAVAVGVGVRPPPHKASVVSWYPTQPAPNASFTVTTSVCPSGTSTEYDFAKSGLLPISPREFVQMLAGSKLPR